MQHVLQMLFNFLVPEHIKWISRGVFLRVGMWMQSFMVHPFRIGAGTHSNIWWPKSGNTVHLLTDVHYRSTTYFALNLFLK